jgi:hypothetical protein
METMHLQPILRVSVLWGSVSEMLFEMVCVCRLDPICLMRIGNALQSSIDFKTFYE